MSYIMAISSACQFATGYTVTGLLLHPVQGMMNLWVSVSPYLADKVAWLLTV